MNWYYYKIDFEYNESIKDFQIISSTTPTLTNEFIIGWLDSAIANQVESYKVIEIWELREIDEFPTIPFQLKRKMFPID